MSHLTISYFTSRKEPMIEWFFDALHRECAGDYSDLRVVVVDFWAQPVDGWTTEDVMRRFGSVASKCRVPPDRFVHVPPKPTVWQGPHRRTKVNWWAASNARNTAICLAPDGWIAFVDDISVFKPGWLKEVRDAMSAGDKTITLGAYKKVKNLVVSDGVITSCDEHPAGVDNRLAHVKNDEPIACSGQWLYGCSLVAPVEAFIAINGFSEVCDGLSFEDVIAGIMLQKKGYSLVYRPRMMTFESEERHHDGLVMKRSDYGISPNDKSHAILRMAQNGDGFAPNYFEPGGIRELRVRVMNGQPFPVSRIPEHEWYTSTRLEEL